MDLLVQLFIVIALHWIVRRLSWYTWRSSPPTADTKDGTDASATKPIEGVSNDITSESRESDGSAMHHTAVVSSDEANRELEVTAYNTIEKPPTRWFDSIRTGEGGTGGRGGIGGRGGDVNITQNINNGQGDLARLKEVLKPADMDASGHEECLEDTRRDVIEPILSWADDLSTEANVHWLNGSAGLGKSSIANSVAAERREQCGAYLFFNRNNPSASDPHLVIRTIAYKVAESNLAIRLALLKVIEQAPGIATEPLLAQFMKLLLEPLSHLNTPLLIILDALDECGRPETRRGLVNLIMNKFTTLPNQVKFLVTSRPEDDIAGVFTRHSKISSFELLACDSIRDVDLFLQHNLFDIRERRRALLKADWPGPSRLEKLCDYAQGVFIWAATALRVISLHYNPDAALNKLLASMSDSDHSLDDLYTTTLKAIGYWEDPCFSNDFRLILGAIVFGQVPMTVQTIDELLALENPSSSILSTLRSLLQYSEDQPILTLHASFSDYLTDPKHLGTQPWFIDEATLQKDVTRCCLRLMKESLRFNICDIETSYLLNEEVPGLGERVQERVPESLRYACKHYADHLSQVKPSCAAVLAEMDFFMRHQLLFWLEVMSLVSKDGLVTPAMAKVEGWYQNNSKELGDLASEVIKFMNVFRSVISQSTPHLYISAVPMWRQDSHLRHIYDCKFKEVVRVEGGDANLVPSLQKIITGHTSSVTSVAFSPDGKHIVSGSGDTTVRVWDAETGSVVAGPFQGHTSYVTSVAFSPGGKRIVSGSYDTTVRVWDAETGSVVAGPFQGHTSYVTSVAFSPDGKRIVSGSGDRTVRVWDADTGSVVAGPFQGHTSYVTSVAFSPDGKRIVSGSYDTTVRVWDAETGSAVAGPFQGHTFYVTSVAFSPDGKRIISGSDDTTVRVWDAETGSVVAGPFQGHTEEVRSVAFSPNGKRIVSGSNDTTVRVWDAETGSVAAEPFQGHTSYVTSVTFSPDGKRIISGSNDTTVRVWDAEAGTLLSTSVERYPFVHGLHDISTPLPIINSTNAHQNTPPWVFQHDGWLKTVWGVCLLWIPHYYPRSALCLPPSTLVIGEKCIKLNMAHFVHGTRWTECFHRSPN